MSKEDEAIESGKNIIKLYNDLIGIIKLQKPIESMTALAMMIPLLIESVQKYQLENNDKVMSIDEIVDRFKDKIKKNYDERLGIK